MYEDDFLTGDLIEEKIGERIFKLKPLTGKEYDIILDKNLTIEGDKMNVSLASRNEFWIKQCVIEAPYKKGEVNFKDLKPEERVEIIQKLKPYLRTALMKKITELNEGTEEEKKSLN